MTGTTTTITTGTTTTTGTIPTTVRRGYQSCWDYYWYDPFFDCGWSSFGYYSTIAWRPWRLYDPWWGPSFYFTGWPSHRYIRHSYYRYAWGSPWHTRYGYWGYYGTPRLARLYSDYGRSYRYGTAYPRGYVTRDGYRGARRTPLFGPRYKESPRVLVTDNGPERRTSRAIPRGDQSGILGPRVTPLRGGDARNGDRQARPRSGVTDTERPRIRSRTPNTETRATPQGRVRSGSDRGRDDSRVTRPSTGRTQPPAARSGWQPGHRGPGSRHTTVDPVRDAPEQRPPKRSLSGNRDPRHALQRASEDPFVGPLDPEHTASGTASERWRYAVPHPGDPGSAERAIQRSAQRPGLHAQPTVGRWHTGWIRSSGASGTPGASEP